MLRRFAFFRAVWLVALVIGLSLGSVFVAGAAASVGGRVPLDESSLVGSRGSNVNNVLTQTPCSPRCETVGAFCFYCYQSTYTDIAPGTYGGYDFGTVTRTCNAEWLSTCDPSLNCTAGVYTGTCSAPNQVTVQPY